jgi:hypothetical protein
MLQAGLSLEQNHQVLGNGAKRESTHVQQLAISMARAACRVSLLVISIFCSCSCAILTGLSESGNLFGCYMLRWLSSYPLSPEYTLGSCQHPDCGLWSTLDCSFHKGLTAAQNYCMIIMDGSSDDDAGWFRLNSASHRFAPAELAEFWMMYMSLAQTIVGLWTWSNWQVSAARCRTDAWAYPGDLLRSIEGEHVIELNYWPLCLQMSWSAAG